MIQKEGWHTTPSSASTTSNASTTSISSMTTNSSTSTSTNSVASIFTSSIPISSAHPTASTSISTSAVPTSPPAGQLASNNPVCIGSGIDSSSDGLLAALILPTAIGLIIWAIPQLPSDVSEAGHSAGQDADLFPSDEQLAQRAIWISFLIVLGWSILGLAGALPLYLVSTPCLANQPHVAVFGGSYSALQDLSLARLLRAFDASNVSPSALIAIHRRDLNDPHNLRPRIIILTVFAIVLALFPAVWKILREFDKHIAYRNRWIEIKCQGLEMAWLSASKAPGFVGWGEKRFKDFILKAGLSSSLDKNGNGNGNGSRSAGHQYSRHGGEREPLNDSEKASLEVDIQSLFSICDTEAIALLIEERDEILENLEIAETRYINSFRLTTPDPSLADWEPKASEDPARPYISRPRPLGLSRERSRGRRSKNPAFAASSLAPTSFVAPSQYYRLKGVSGVSGGRFTDSLYWKDPSLSESGEISMNRDSQIYNHLPLGSREGVGSVSSLPYPDPRKYGPNYTLDSSNDNDQSGLRTLEEEPEWMELSDATPDIASADNGAAVAGPSSFKRPLKSDNVPSVHRETFPFRQLTESVPPPHLRLQSAQPFVQPMEGINYDDLGDITEWRSKLKAINAEIANAQSDSYNDIADGARIKGWLLVGRGLRFIPGIKLIEGRAKEDVRWDVLQNERTNMDSAALWTCVLLAAVFLAGGLTAAVGLSLSTAPDVAHFLPFLSSFLSDDQLGSGIVTILIPALAICLFIILALTFVRWIVNVQGSVSISDGQLLIFKTTFLFMTVVVGLLLLTIGGLLFAIEAFSSGTTPGQAVADGSIYMTVLATAIIFQVAIIIPGLLLLQPRRLWNVVRAEKRAITPRERFRAYDPSFAMAACILASNTCNFHLMSRKFWIEGGVLVGTGGAVILFVEVYASLKTRRPGRNTLSPITRDSLETFLNTAKSAQRTSVDEASTSVSGPRPRGSMASVLEMMSLTLAVMPSSSPTKSPVPLETETLDDLISTEKAARTNPSAPPHLPPLPFTHAEEMAGILYAPELIAPNPVIWLPYSTVAKSEALDLAKYHDLAVTLDVRTKDQAVAMERKSTS
ncbi:hypothetical protein D9757_002324 [Collybiopsis confluens]|uniref:CSC1/OSCA1-like 7TM region domain-containing protein n=1 Tax=Collybiopsis confluens TaxID=2823264 RepID=A0A8H5I0D7_9AGAR|nr:hypothetical protein D9757_002324 [Collybiopsis confluens]